MTGTVYVSVFACLLLLQGFQPIDAMQCSHSCVSVNKISADLDRVASRGPSAVAGLHVGYCVLKVCLDRTLDCDRWTHGCWVLHLNLVIDRFKRYSACVL